MASDGDQRKKVTAASIESAKTVQSDPNALGTAHTQRSDADAIARTDPGNSPRPGAQRSPPEVRDDEPPDIPGYVIGELLGSGGFGRVYRAHQTALGRDVAIKVLNARLSAHPEAMSRFLSEARAVGKLSHPGIVDVFELDTLPDGRQYLVMELVRGATLREVLRERGALPLEEALPLLRSIAAAIDAAHAAGIAHRDLKPDNVFVVDGGTKLIDFGLAKLTREQDAPVTQTGTVFGTPLYMSPEQCRGKAATLATDAYSFGVLAYEVLAGVTPFTGDAIGLALHHLNDAPRPPSSHRDLGEQSARVDRVILALLAKAPEQRPLPLAPVIDAIVEGALPARPRRGRTRWIAGAIAVASASAAFAWSQREHDAAPAVSTVDDGCGLPGARLAGVWDARLRDQTGARFLAANRDETTRTWSVLEKELDGYATAWSAQWSEACAAPDRTTDALLHAQRLNCLDSALLALRGVAGAASAADPVAYSEGYTGESTLPVLADCRSTAVLRALPPAPSAAHRDEVGAWIAKMQQARSLLRTSVAGRRPELVEGALKALEESAAALDRLESPIAAEAWTWKADLLHSIVRFGWRQDDVRAAFDHAVRRATELRNDAVMPMLLLTRLRSERERGAGPTQLAALLEQIAQALDRAGRPMRATADLEYARAELALDRGDIAAAGAHYDKANAIIDRYAPQRSGRPRQRPLGFLRRNVQHAEAAELTRTALEDALEQWGPRHRRTVLARITYGMSLYRLFDHAGATRELAQVGAFDELIGSFDELKWLDPRLAECAFASGDVATGKRALERVSKVRKDDDPDHAALQNALAATAHVHVAAHVLAHAAEPAGDLQRLQRVEGRAVLAVMRAKYDEVITHAKAAIAIADRLRMPVVSHSLLPQALVKRGDVAAATRLTEQLERSYVPTDPREPRLKDGTSALRRLNALGGRIALHVARRRWDDARTAMEKARAIAVELGFPPPVLAEGDGELGRVLLELGDTAGAIAKLEQVLVVADSCCDGFTFYTPETQFALARALVAAKGDRGRARRLAEIARRGFMHLDRQRDADEVSAWLARLP